MRTNAINACWLVSTALLLLAGCVTPAEPAPTLEPPAWYDKRDLFSGGNPNIIVGFGRGTGEQATEEAEGAAKSEIAKEINSRIEGGDECVTRVSNAGRRNESVSRDCATQTKLSFRDDLIGIKKAESDHRDGYYYVAYTYDRSPAYQKIATELRQSGFTCPPERGAIPTAQTEFDTDMSEAAGCRVPWELSYNASGQPWSIHLDQQNINQPLIQFSMEQFLPDDATGNATLRLTFSKETVQEKEPYFVTAPTNENGYLSLFYIDEQGRALVLIDNQKVTKALKQIEYPDSQQKEGLVSEITDGDRSSIREYYLSTNCSMPLDLRFFSKVAATTTAEDVLKHNYGTLLEGVKKGQCSTLSGYVTIQKN